MNAQFQAPNLKIKSEDLSPFVLTVGDPQRASHVAKMMENAQLIGENREYRTYTGLYKGKRISVCSHGVGASGASVCFEELFQAGVQVIIRAGTCGSLVEDIADGQFVIVNAAVREDGVTNQLIPAGFPAVADMQVCMALQKAAKENGYNDVKTGMTVTEGLLYPGLMPSTLPLWKSAGVLCVEMEVAMLFVQASLHGRKAGGIITSDGYVLKGAEPGQYNPHREVVEQGKQNMLQIALDALADLA